MVFTKPAAVRAQSYFPIFGVGSVKSRPFEPSKSKDHVDSYRLKLEPIHIVMKSITDTHTFEYQAFCSLQLHKDKD
jgi:hypothetical protein